MNPIDNLMAILYGVYEFSRTYQPTVIEEQPNGNYKHKNNDR